MESPQQKQLADYGPYSYCNWRSQLEEEPLPHSAVEVQLFSDAHFIGTNIEHGPYFVMNAEPWPPVESPKSMYARLILRCEGYLDSNQDPTLRTSINTDTSRYHGGTFFDEMAALYSLCWGVRLRAGGVVRQFSSINEYGTYGKPRTPRPDETPIFFPPHDGRYVLPWHPADRNMSEINEQIKSYVMLKPKQASVLIRAARLYQDSVWLAESDPEISWLLLASAVEVAANYWYPEEKIPPDPEEQLKHFKPELVEELNNLKHDQAKAIEIVSKHLQSQLGATKKFKTFLIKFRPQQPPSSRPISFQIKWNKSSMNDIFHKIYDCRSQALHGGTPFPKSMCSPPRLDNQNNIPYERPDIGISESSFGASWLAEDVPIHFHVFEYIVRHSLLNWWQDMIEKIQSDRTAQVG